MIDREKATRKSDGYGGKFTPVEIACPKCGSSIYRNDGIILASYPPMRQYKCVECGWFDITY